MFRVTGRPLWVRARCVREAWITIPFFRSSFRSVVASKMFDVSREVFRIVSWDFLDGRLLYHCKAPERCHANVLIRQLLLKYPEAYVVGLSYDVHPQEVALAMVLARQEINDGERSVTYSEDEPLFPTRLGRVSRIPSARDLLFAGDPEGVTLEGPRVWDPNTNVAPGSGADVCANSGPSSEKESHSGPMGHASVPFRHASCGAVSSPLGVVIRSDLQIAKESYMVLTFADVCANSGPS